MKEPVINAHHPLRLGWSQISITPNLPVNLAGQFHPRIAHSVHDPVTATALAIEAGGEQAVLVSCDLVVIRPLVMQRLREKLRERLPDLNVGKVIVSATHTHTAPDTSFEMGEPFPSDDFMPIFTYRLPPGVLRPQEYVEFLVDRLAEVVAAAWEKRQPGGLSWALGHAVVGCNRRMVYQDGRARMYGNPAEPAFRWVEGGEDHGVELLFCWDEGRRLTGVVVNLGCPSQVSEGESHISADFWHEVRQELRARHGERLFTLGLTGAAGDQSPHPLFRQRAEAAYRQRIGLSERQVIARRIAGAVQEGLEATGSDVRAGVPFAHHIETLSLPVRRVTSEEVEWARSQLEPLEAKGETALSDVERMFARRWRSVIARWERQERDPCYPMELHVLRLGDVAVATNPFELFLDYGLRIKARSPAEQTLVVQLACGVGGYLPTARAVAGGGYGAEIVDNFVGPEGGDLLVERTVEVIASLWEDAGGGA